MKIGAISVLLSANSPIGNDGKTESLLGITECGPDSFLSLLEVRLGVNTAQVSFTSRLVDYLNCLEQCKNKKMFYFRSYEADPFAVARKLLHWRDELYLAGWTGHFSTNDNLSKRLMDLAKVETLARTAVEPGVGQRWQHVIERLKTDEVHIKDITLKDPLNYFEPLVQTGIKAIGADITEENSTELAGTENTDLANIKHQVFQNGPKAALNHDNSIILIEATDMAEAAQLTRNITAKQFSEVSETIPVLLCQNDGYIIDEHFEDAGLPRAGFSQNSPWRPVFQVLPLALELLWDPVSPRKLIQFLTNPVCPLPARARYRLGNLIAEKPGIGSEAWEETVQGLVEKEEDKKAGKKLRKSIESWLECERFNPEAGIETKVILERIALVSSWLGSAMSINDDENMQSLFAIAKGQAEDLSNAVQRLSRYNDGQLTQANLRRLIDDIRGVGAPIMDRDRELSTKRGFIPSATNPASMLNSVSKLIWTGLSGENLLRLPFVTDSEREALIEHDVIFMPEALNLKSVSDYSLRPLRHSQDQLILIALKNRQADHPLWSRITTNNPDLKIVTSKEAQTRLSIHKTNLSALTLPAKQREWKLPKKFAYRPPNYSSYSSLDKFLYKPHQWILGYPASIKTGSLVIADEGNLLKGKLAHRLIEIYLDQHTDLQSVDLAKIDLWTENTLPELLKREGAILLEEGAFRERVEFQNVMKLAMSSLIKQMVAAGLSATETEKWEEAQFIGGSLQGSIDILAKTPDGNDVIIDIKYGGLPYRRDELEKSQYLQLATYDRLNGGEPYLSYFIIRDAQMLNLAHNLFKQGERVDPELGLTPDDYWSNIELMWSHREKALNDGLIEVPVEGTEPNERSAPDSIALGIPETNDAFSDYTALTGWETGA